MNTTRPMLAAFLLCVVVGSLAADQVREPIRAEQLLIEGIDGEKLAESGQLCFQLTLDGTPETPMIPAEVAQVDRIEYAWAAGGKFRIVLMGKGAVLRTIVSDGKLIDTGEKVWDARFAFDFNRHPTEASERLVNELNHNSMWAYNRILSVHLHPLSWFQNTRTIEGYRRDYRISLGTTDDVVQLIDPNDEHHLGTIQIAHGEIPYAAHCDPGHFLSSITYDRSEIVHIDKIGSLPRRCVVLLDQLHGTPLRWTSELCAEQLDATVDPAVFAVKPGAEGVISWRYGSVVKNVGYGVVNFFKDLWERVSDGQIGD